MNHKQKLGYTLLGAGIMAIGIIIGQVITPEIEAQSNGVFDKIICKEIEVVDKAGKRIAFLGGGVSSWKRTAKNNFFEIFNKDGEKAIRLSADGPVNAINIYDPEGHSAIDLEASVGGLTRIFASQEGKLGFKLEFLGDQRTIAVFDPSKTDNLVFGKEAFEVNVSNTRNELQLWGKSPYQKGIGFYGDSNKAKMTKWNPSK